MVIKSSSGEIRRLVAALSSGDAVRRESAVARLAVVGSRATDRLLAAYDTAGDTAARVGILRALEAITATAAAPDVRTLGIACSALKEGAESAVAAAAVLKPLIDARDAAIAAAALDALVETALDASRDQRVRLAAYAALQNIPAEMLARITKAVDIDTMLAGRQEGGQAPPGRGDVRQTGTRKRRTRSTRGQSQLPF
jgi:hypothetical protein